MILYAGLFVGGAVVGSVATFVFHGTIIADVKKVVDDIANAVNAIKTKLGA